MIDKITDFSEKFGFLSNDYFCLVHYDGVLYPSVSHAFQGARVKDENLKERISKIHDLQLMYQLVEDIEDPPNWSKDRIRVMEVLIRDKFRRNTVLRQRLTETAPSLLQNSYPDSSNPSNLFWGTVNERGENLVGKLLMKVRSDIEKDVELENWLLQTFDLISNPAEMPRLILHEFLGPEKLRKVTLEEKRFYVIGNALDADLKFHHESIEAYHAVLLFDKGLGMTLIDLNSSTGTYINGSRVRKMVPAPVEIDDYLSFGEKKKKYKTEIYVEHIRREYERRIREINKELETLDNIQNFDGDPEELKQSLGLKKVRVENLPRKMSNKKGVEDVFGMLGVEDSNFSEKYVSIKFKDQKSAETAVNWNGMTVQGRKLKIYFNRERSRSR